MEKVGAALCFDLFAGRGTYTDALYRERFERVVCMEKQAAKCAEIVKADNVTIYCADNRTATRKVIGRWGTPDFVDLDAWGSPDFALQPLLEYGKLKQTAIVATDGLFSGRQQAGVMPKVWGHGKVKMAPQACGSDEWPYLIEHHLRTWAAKCGLQSSEFLAQRPRGSVVWYWAALVERAE